MNCPFRWNGTKGRLCGCATLNEPFYFLWLLFGSRADNVWTTAGYSGSSTLPRALAKHEKSVIHIQSQISLTSFGHSRIDMVLDGQCLVLARKQEKTEKS